MWRWVGTDRSKLSGSPSPLWACMLTEPTEPLLATNHLARALYAPLLADPRRPANAARFIYLDPAARDFFPDWDSTADGIAAMLRAEAGRNPYDKDLSDLIGQLSTRSEIFRKRWADHKSAAATAPVPRSSTTRSSETSNSTSKP